MIQFLKSNKISLLILTIFLGVYGFFSLLNIPKEASPSVNIPNYIVTLMYPGADPQTIEEQVVDKLEKKIKGVNGVKNISSTSSYNIGIINVEFFQNIEDVNALNDLKSSIDQIISSLPSDVKYPTIKKIDISDTPIYTFSIAGPYEANILYEKTKELEDRIKAISGVSDLNIIGKPIQEIKLNFDFNKIASLDLDFGYIINQLKTAFIKLPADKKDINGSLYSFEINNYSKNIKELVEEIKNLEIINKESKTIKVSDIADVVLSYKKNDKKSFVFDDINKKETINALSFQIKKIPGYDIEKLTQLVKSEIGSFQLENKELKVVETLSQEEDIKKMYTLFIENFFETGILVFLIVFIFLGFKSSLAISISFIIVYLTNFIYLKGIGYSFNNIVSFSLILVLGIMIDNLIVLSQGIVVGLRETGDIWKAIGYSIKTYAKAIIFGTSTTIAIFIPLYFGLSGIMGEFIKPMPITIISNLTISLIITIIILPVITTLIYRSNDKQEINNNVNTEIKTYKTNFAMNYIEKVGKNFGDLFYKLNIKRRNSFFIVLSFILFFIFSIFLIGSGLVKVDFMGNTDSNNLWINLKYQPGISLEQNQENTSNIANDILGFFNKSYPNIIEYISVDIGSERSGGSIIGGGGGSSDTNNIASFTIRLIDGKYRKDIKSYIITENLQTFLQKDIKNKYVLVEDAFAITQKAGPGGGKPIGFYITGKDYIIINDYIEKIKPKIKAINGIYNITTSIEYTNGRFVYKIDENKAKQLGINTMSIAMIIMGLQNSDYQPNGIKIKDFNEFGTETLPLNAYVKYDGSFNDLKIGKIYINQLIQKKTLEPELKGINKIDGDKVILIQADKLNSVPLQDIVKEIDKIIKENPLPDGMQYKTSGDVETQTDSMKDMGNAMIIGLILMYIVLIIQFNKIKYANVILLSAFLSISGAIFILWIFGMPFGFVSQIGLFGVIGVVCNQALIHIEDFKDFYEKKGMSVIDSFRISIAERFVPIFLTKITTIVGLIILAFKDELFGNLAVSFIGGLIISFFLTLLFLPSLMRFVSKDYYNETKKND